ncbi:MAG: hydrogenase formation protein HypD, partial [Aquificota bacterium]
MKTAIVSEFKSSQRVKAFELRIKKDVERLGSQVRIMEFCGGHTHSIIKFGIDELLKGYVRFVHGPGCPVCVLPTQRIDLAIELAKIPSTILCTYGDLLRVPGSNGKSLLSLRSEGYDVRMVYSCLDVLRIAEENPSKEAVFFAIGFETTTPQTALLLQKAKMMGLKNLSVVSNHVLTPPA